MQKTYSVIIPSFRRHENIPLIVKRLKESTIKPTKILIWNDNDEPPGKYLNPDDFDDDVEIVNSNTNRWCTWAGFMMAFCFDTDFVAVVDDDTLPGRKWFEFCLNNIGCGKQIFSGFGIKLVSNKYDDRKAWFSRVSKEVNFVKVDMAGQSYFFPKDAIIPLFTMRPPFWYNNVDLHFSFMARKAGYKIFVPFPTESEQLPFSKGLPISPTERALFVRAGQSKRNEYVIWAIKNKIINKVV